MDAGVVARPGWISRWLALLMVALVTAPTVLSLGVLPGVVWVAVELGPPWPAAVAAGLVAAAVAYLALGPERGYYRLRPFEVSGAVYRRLGVRLFRRFVVSGDYFNRWAARCDPQHRGARSLAEVRRAERCGRASERAHVAGAAFLLPPTACAVLGGQPGLAAGLVLVNVLTNVYPVLLLRYTRGRLRAILARRPLARPAQPEAGRPAELGPAPDPARMQAFRDS